MNFDPDIFSNVIPIWEPLAKKKYSFFRKICEEIPDEYLTQVKTIHYSGSLEINSSNYRIESNSGNCILLKKWPIGAKEKNVERIQKLTNWLIEKNIPAAYSGTFKNSKYATTYKDSLWSFNIFFDGQYFTGLNNELESAARITGRLANILFDLPSELSPPVGPIYFSDLDRSTMNLMKKKKDVWDSYFGFENKKLLVNHWDYLSETWNNLSQCDLFDGPITTCHYDMHPHNLLTKNGKIIAVLDFESCEKIPLGYSLAFNALKQCRQYLSLDKENTSYKSVADIYYEVLRSEIRFKEFTKFKFLSLSKCEVFRRLLYIFKLNLIENNHRWNHVLPIQISLLYESDKLFYDL